MQIPRFSPNQKLLTGTAVLGLISIGTNALGGPVLAGIANFSAGMVGNNLGTLVEKLRENRDILRNQDLAKAAGRSVGLTLAKISPQFPRIKNRLKKLAGETEGYWLAWEERAENLNLFESLREDQLVKIFSNNPEEFSQYPVLAAAEWREVVAWLFERGCQQGVLLGSPEDYQDVRETLAQELELNFNKNLREVLKDDANGGEAFAGMLLDLLGAIRAKMDELATREDIALVSQRLATREDIARLSQDMARLSQALEHSRRQGGEASPTATLLPVSGAVDTVPKMPPHFLPRPEDIEKLKERLLAPATQTLVMTGQPRKIGLQGMGGIGKSVLAAALAREMDVRRRFRDGVVWLTVGINPQPIALYERLAKALGESYAYMEGEAQWDAYLSNLLAAKSCLLVLDDVWEQQEAQRFVEVLGEDCRLLLTTRDSRLIAGLGAQEYRVEMLAEGQAKQLLANWAGLHLEMLPPEADEVTKHCGNLPLALALCGAQVKQGTSWADLLRALQEADLKFLDHPHGSIYKSLDTSVAALEETKRRAYLELGLLAPDVPASEAALVTLWGRGGDIPDHKARTFLTELAQRALLFVEGKSPERWVSLHDVQQKYLEENLEKNLEENLKDAAALHRDWLRAYGGGKFPWCGAEVQGETYLYRQAAYHFQKAGEEEAFKQLLADFDWLQQKLAATDIEAVLRDFAALRVWSKVVAAGSPPNPPLAKGGGKEAPLFKGGLGGSAEEYPILINGF